MYCIYERLCILGVLGRKILCYKFIRSWLREKTPSEKNINLLHYITLCVGHIFLGFWSSGSWNHGGDLFDQYSCILSINHVFSMTFYMNTLKYSTEMYWLIEILCSCWNCATVSVIRAIELQVIENSSYWKFELLKIRVIENSSYRNLMLSRFWIFVHFLFEKVLKNKEKIVI